MEPRRQDFKRRRLSQPRARSRSSLSASEDQPSSGETPTSGAGPAASSVPLASSSMSSSSSSTFRPSSTGVPSASTSSSVQAPSPHAVGAVLRSLPVPAPSVFSPFAIAASDIANDNDTTTAVASRPATPDLWYPTLMPPPDPNLQLGHRAQGGGRAACASFVIAKDDVDVGVWPALSPRPRSTTPPGTFPQFSQLPPELRVHVWRLAAEAANAPSHPLRVRLYRGSERIRRPNNKRSYWTRQVLRLAAMPELARVTRFRRSLLQVCREARNEVTKLWDRVVQLERGRALHFSFAHDMVYLDIVNHAVMDDLIRLRREGQLPEFATAVGHIGFDMTPTMPHWIVNTAEDMDPTVDFILCFPSLHSVSLVNFGAFRNEIKWHAHDDASWILSRTRGHSVYLRSFPALEGVNYNEKGRVGNRNAGSQEKHDCAICTIHKCVYVRALLQNQAPLPVVRPRLTDEQNRWLAGLAHHTLIASTPAIARRVRSYDNGSRAWWLKRTRGPGLSTAGGESEAEEEEEEEEEGDDDNDTSRDHYGGIDDADSDSNASGPPPQPPAAGLAAALSEMPNEAFHVYSVPPAEENENEEDGSGGSDADTSADSMSVA